MPFDPPPSDDTEQQLLRYEALFKLIDDIAGLDKLQAFASQLASHCKDFADLASWRLVVPSGDSFLVIDACQGLAHVTEMPALGAWDERHWPLSSPSLIEISQPEALDQLPESLKGPDISSILVIPFEHAGQTIGLLSAAAEHEPFSELDKKFLQLFGRHLSHQLAGLLLRQKARRVLKDQASHDALTQLLNRSAIVQELSSKLALSKRTGQALGLIMLDLDFFKHVNDVYGQQAGDEVLREVAARLREQTRDGDSLGRYGGEEFLVLLYPCSEQEVEVAAERLRLAIEEKPALLGGCSANPIDLTISLGITSSNGQGSIRVEKLLKQADDALYHAKASGRNRTTRYGAGPCSNSQFGPIG